MSAARLWLVRHGPTGRGGFVGRTDAPADLSDLVALGALAARLPERAALLHSGMLRTRLTAAALMGQRPGLQEGAVEPELREQDFGLFDGMGYDEASSVYPTDYAEFWLNPAMTSPPEGESFAQVCARVAASLSALSGDVVLCVHAGTIRAALALALDLTPAQALAFEIAPLSLTRLTRYESADGAVWSVGGVNIL